MNPELPSEVVEAYAFANTPAYLYRKLSASTFVAALASESTSKLKTSLLSAEIDHLESVALAYAVALALLRRNIDPLKLVQATDVQLDWLPSLVALYRIKNISNTTQYIKYPTTVIAGIVASSKSAALTPFNITKAPKL